MDILEQIKAEVELRKGICRRAGDFVRVDYYIGKGDAYEEMLSFLDTLQDQPVKSPNNEDSDEIIKRSVEAIQKGNGCGYIKPIEQPVCEGLEDETLRVEFKKIEHQCFEDGIFGWEKEKLIARHFYDLGRQGKGKVIEGLEEEMERFMSNLTEKKGVFPPLTRLGFRAIARHFAQWQKEQMLKEAVEDWAKDGVEIHSTIVEKIGGIDIVECPVNTFYEGQKVRIVIVKED